MTRVWASVLLGLSVGACGVGDDGTHSTITTPNDALGVVCDDPLTTTGTWQMGTVCSDTGNTCSGTCPGGATCAAVQPATALGCYPIGTWTFTATLTGTEACAAPVQLLPSYTVVLTQISDQQGDPVQIATYTTDPTTHSRTKVSSGGSGLCEGDFELFSPDGTQQWNFTPDLNADNSITGQGLYRLYTSDQWD
jgi:hypothetical protein